MFGSSVIAAGGNNWMTGIIPVVIAIIYLLNHVLAARKPAPPARNKPQRRPPEAGERPLRPAQKQAPGQSSAQINAEIEQFLKRAGERRGERARREPPLKAPVTTRTPLRSEAVPQAPPRSVEVEPVGPREFDAVAESVAKHLAHRGFSDRTEHLADDIVHADQQMEQHLQKAFNRRVGTLGDTTAVAPSAPVTDVAPAPAIADSTVHAALAGLLANPQSLKQAVVLNEILGRPEHRW